MKKVRFLINKGFSSIEVLLAASVFVAVVSVFVGAIIFGTQSQKTAGQYNQASLLAEETFEAVRNIRDSGFTNLPSVDGTYYLSSLGNQWSLVSTPEAAINGFTRSVTVTTVDATTKSIVVNISFAPSAYRTKTLSYTSKITNWISNTSGGGSPKKRGLLAYYDATGGRNTLTSRQYDDVANTFGIEEDISLGAGQNSRNIILKTSPTKGEAILAYGDNAGNLKVLCYDDSTDVWTQDYTATIGGTGTTKRFDVEYEKTTGDALVVY
ncbi:hypothetical protein HGB13_03975, partial [bacterium]|nr:hypothetical protein [bacterium]